MDAPAVWKLFTESSTEEFNRMREAMPEQPVDFSDEDLVGFNRPSINLSRADLQQTNFRDCNLEGADFRGATFRETRFINCRLTNARFDGNESGASFDSCER